MNTTPMFSPHGRKLSKLADLTPRPSGEKLTSTTTTSTLTDNVAVLTGAFQILSQNTFSDSPLNLRHYVAATPKVPATTGSLLNGDTLSARWTICVRVTGVKPSSTDRKHFTCWVTDSYNTIKVLAYEDNVQVFEKIIETTKVYFISDGKLKIDIKEDDQGDLVHDYMIVLNEYSTVIPCLDEQFGPATQFTQLDRITEPEYVDVFGVVESVGELTRVEATTLESLPRRVIILSDESERPIQIVLFKNKAGQFDARVNDVIAIRRLKRRQIGLFSCFLTSVTKNPDVSELQLSRRKAFMEYLRTTRETSTEMPPPRPKNFHLPTTDISKYNEESNRESADQKAIGMKQEEAMATSSRGNQDKVQKSTSPPPKQNDAKNKYDEFKKMKKTMDKFRAWKEESKFTFDLKTVSKRMLADALRQFYEEVRKSDGTKFTPATLMTYRSHIQNYFHSEDGNRRDIDIVSDPEFVKANMFLKSMTTSKPRDKNAPVKARTKLNKFCHQC